MSRIRLIGRINIEFKKVIRIGTMGRISKNKNDKTIKKMKKEIN
jgi:hypothetical protein